jgi:hypothetical protein
MPYALAWNFNYCAFSAFSTPTFRTTNRGSLFGCMIHVVFETLEGTNDTIDPVDLPILMYGHRGEVQIDCGSANVKITDAQLVGINTSHIFQPLSPHSPVYSPGLEHFFHELQGSIIAMLGKGKSGNIRIIHHDGSAW